MWKEVINAQGSIRKEFLPQPFGSGVIQGPHKYCSTMSLYVPTPEEGNQMGKKKKKKKNLNLQLKFSVYSIRPFTFNSGNELKG